MLCDSIPDKIKVSIIIVNYNTKQITSNCIESIFSKTKGISFEIILIDNASTDGSKEFFEKDKRIKYIYLQKNIGFGCANNIGIKQAVGNFFFFLNSDTYLLNNAIEFFLNYATYNINKNSIYGTWLVNEEGARIHSYGEFPTIKSELCKALQVYIIRIPFIKKYIQPYEEIFFQEGLNVDYITGADIFMHRNIINKCGVFDNRFFMYYEESDWQKRMQEKGIIRRIINGPQIVHLCGASQNSSKDKNITQIKIFTKSMFMYIHKHYGYYKYLSFRIVFFFLRFMPILVNNNYKIKEKMSYIATLIK